MKSVLMSIKPEWCEKIANGWKTMELRKTKPKIELPFKVYIYCTNNKDMLWVTRENERNCEKIASRCMAKSVGGATKANGKVIGEFVCDYVQEVFPTGLFDGDDRLTVCGNEDMPLDKYCLTEEQVRAYIGDKKAYGWHIYNLVIYNKPKELSEFVGLRKTKFGFEPVGVKPPQSWCYMEEHNAEE